MNEVYHQYNQNQYPFVYLNITIARAEVDINVTPDKRQIFLSNENCLILIIKVNNSYLLFNQYNLCFKLTINLLIYFVFKYYFYYKASLNKLFENIPSTYKINTSMYESISNKRPYESTTESKQCKCKQNNYI